jgi:hypothetical protein
MSENRISTKIPTDLILALESVRTRLSIAIAAESKSTPPASRQQYLDTAERISRFVRKLRKNGCVVAVNINIGSHVWASLQQISEENDARRLCQILEDMVSELE